MHVLFDLRGHHDFLLAFLSFRYGVVVGLFFEFRRRRHQFVADFFVGRALLVVGAVRQHALELHLKIKSIKHHPRLFRASLYFFRRGRVVDDVTVVVEMHVLGPLDVVRSQLEVAILQSDVLHLVMYVPSYWTFPVGEFDSHQVESCFDSFAAGFEIARHVYAETPFLQSYFPTDLAVHTCLYCRLPPLGSSSLFCRTISATPSRPSSSSPRPRRCHIRSLPRGVLPSCCFPRWKASNCSANDLKIWLRYC
jgi:hypothetical protein